MKISTISWIGLLLVSLGACQSGAPLTLTSADAGKVIEIDSGRTIRVTLGGNPTTGYTWQLAEDSDASVEMAGEAEFKPQSNALGAGGQQTLIFKAGPAGQGILKLVYLRPFEVGVPPIDTYEVTLIVR